MREREIRDRIVRMGVEHHHVVLGREIREHPGLCGQPGPLAGEIDEPAPPGRDRGE